MYIYIYMCIYIYISNTAHTCIHSFIHSFIHSHICTCEYVSVYIYTQAYIYIYIHILHAVPDEVAAKEILPNGPLKSRASSSSPGFGGPLAMNTLGNWVDLCYV